MRATKLLVLVAAAVALEEARADTIILKNGSQLEGKVIDDRARSGRVILDLGPSGKVFFRAAEVDRIVPVSGAEAAKAPAPSEAREAPRAGEAVIVTLRTSPEKTGGGTYQGVLSAESTDEEIVLELPAAGDGRPAGRLYLRKAEVESIVPAAAKEAVAKAPEPAARPGEFVAVTLPRGRDVTGVGTYYGLLSAESTEDQIVLEIPRAGKIRIRGARGATISKTDALVAGLNPAPEVPSERVIRTTHVVHLKNGRKLRGTVVETPESEPLKLQVGGRGYVLIPPEEIVPGGIEAQEGSIDLGPEPPAPEAKPAEEAKPQSQEEIKETLRREILEELIEKILEERLQAREEALVPPAETALSVEDAKRIEESLYELTRWRTRNRVRAERQLRAMGSVVIPYLERIAAHPFWLTRRAVQRIVRDIGDPRGAPLAIQALNDEDYYVRAIAHEALKALLPSKIAYNPSGPEKQRLEAMSGYQALWEEISKRRLREALLAEALR